MIVIRAAVLSLMLMSFQTRSAAKGEQLDAAMLKVGSRIWTSQDLSCFLWVWQVLVEGQKKPLRDRFKEHPAVVYKARSWTKNWNGLPEKVKTVLFVAFVWENVSRLNNFVPSQNDKEKAMSRLNLAFGEAQKSSLKAYLNSYTKDERYALYVDPVLRARAWKETLGGAVKNKEIFRIAWNWIGNTK